MHGSFREHDFSRDFDHFFVRVAGQSLQSFKRGLLVHRSREASDRVALLQIVRDRIGHHVYPIHRLDRAASGVILFALDSGAAAASCWLLGFSSGLLPAGLRTFAAFFMIRLRGFVSTSFSVTNTMLKLEPSLSPFL